MPRPGYVDRRCVSLLCIALLAIAACGKSQEAETADMGDGGVVEDRNQDEAVGDGPREQTPPTDEADDARPGADGGLEDGAAAPLPDAGDADDDGETDGGIETEDDDTEDEDSEDDDIVPSDAGTDARLPYPDGDAGLCRITETICEDGGCREVTYSCDDLDACVPDTVDEDGDGDPEGVDIDCDGTVDFSL